MIMPSTPSNGILITIIGVLVSAPFFIWAYILYRRQQRYASSAKSLVLTPHSWAIGLSGMTRYPKEPENEAWLRMEVSVNAIDKPIDTLDVIIDGKTIPANHWHGKNVSAFTVYFKVTEWHWKGKHQVELISKVCNDTSSSGRFPIDFDAEPGGFPRYL